ncbi:hypothetical protein V1511DRAFT_458953 [Dipodascopsis uninucleata]
MRWPSRGSFVVNPNRSKASISNLSAVRNLNSISTSSSDTDDYGIDDEELLDLYLAQTRYKIDVDLPSQVLDHGVQIPEILKMPFQRQMYLRQKRLAGWVDDVGMAGGTMPDYFIGAQANGLGPMNIKGIDYVVYDNMRRRPAKPLTGWRSELLGLSYYPPFHVLGMFAKSRPAVVVTNNQPGKARAVYRTTVRKMIKQCLFDEFCRVQHIEQKWVDSNELSSLQLTEKDEWLGFLRSHHKDPTLLDTKSNDGNEYPKRSGIEKALFKGNDKFIRGIDGVYIFAVKSDVEYNMKLLRPLIRQAVQAVIMDYGYVTPAMKNRYNKELKQELKRVQTVFENNQQTQPENIACTSTNQAKAYKKTTRPMMNWVVRANTEFNMNFADRVKREAIMFDSWARRLPIAKNEIKQYATEYEEWINKKK